MPLTERADGLTVASLLGTRSTSDPQGVFLLLRDQPVTYGEVDGKAESLAAALHNLGIEAGDRIVVDSEPGERLQNDLLGLARRALAVGVLEAQQEAALVMARKSPIEQRSAGPADVERAARARCVACYDRHPAHSSVALPVRRLDNASPAT